MKNILYYGQDVTPPQKIELQAGPLSLVYQEGDLRTIKLGRQEILRRIYVAVRDPNWGTVPAAIQNFSHEAEEDSFNLTFEAHHKQGDIDFTWQASLTGDEDGTITFVMDGVAHSSFQSNRIGFCVLHPAEPCMGKPCEVEGVDGSIERSVFPEFISPQPPFTDMRVLSYAVGAGLLAEVELLGDDFEMEDQRNYADASYKIYSRPVSNPIPFPVQKGEHIRQEVILRLKGSPPSRSQAFIERPMTLSVGETPLHPLPSIGFRFQMEGLGSRDAYIRELLALHLSHLRIDLVLSDEDVETGFKEACVLSEALALPLEITIFLSDQAEQEIELLKRLVEKYRPQVCRWLVFQADQLVSPPELIHRIRGTFSALTPQAKVGGGTNYTFGQVNMERFSTRGWDFLSFPVSPQVHTSDMGTLVENLPGMRYCVESARKLVVGLPIRVTPVSLKPHFLAPSSSLMEMVQTDNIPPDVDLRQSSLFVAGWTIGSLKHLAEAGTSSITYYATTGLRGVMASVVASNKEAVSEDREPSVYPVYHVFADIAEFVGGEVIPTLSSDPHVVEGLAMCEGERLCVLVANLTSEIQDVRIQNLPKRVEYRVLDEANGIKAMVEPRSFRSEDERTVDTDEGEFNVKLRPFAVLRIIGRR
jgi:hypothetical protein